MKSPVAVASVLLLSLNAFAIAFITEADVQKKLGADAVIEISGQSAQKFVTAGSPCDTALISRSSRSYIVKKGTDSLLYVTEEGLESLLECASL